MENKYMKKKFIFPVLIILLILFLIILLGLISFEGSNKIQDKVGQINNNFSNVTYMEDIEFKPNSDYKKVDETLVITNDSKRFYVNDQSMPDPIRVPVNTQLNVEVKNNSSYEISIHFHGILGMNKMDGVGGMTQENIKPGDSFIYQFNLDTAGTYMYHSHVDSLNQVNNEFLYGGLVVEDEEMESAVNKEMLIYNTQENEPEVYVNNKGHLEYNLSDQGDIYLNIVNLSSTPISIYLGDDVEWEVISLDANKVTSDIFKNKELYIPTGNRIDIRIKNPQKSFVIYSTVDGRINSEVGIKINDEIDYKEKRREHFNNDLGVEYFNDSEMLYLYDIIKNEEEVKEEKPDKTYDLELNMQHMAWTINGRAYPNTSTIDVDYNDIVTINLSSPTSMHTEAHPFHLHGHEFLVTEVNGKKLDKTLVMDTVEVLPGEEVTIQFKANNPGIWAFHCHNLNHAALGMMTSVNYNNYSTYISESGQAEE